jgi:hypothetical protein
MASTWRQGDLASVVRKHSPKTRFAIESQSEEEACLSGFEPGPLLLRWLGRLRRQRAVAWQRPNEDAVYELTTLSLDKKPVAPAAFAVAGPPGESECC